MAYIRPSPPVAAASSHFASGKGETVTQVSATAGDDAPQMISPTADGTYARTFSRPRPPELSGTKVQL
jgi:hypothetical protein